MTTQKVTELSSFFSVGAGGNIAQGAKDVARTQTDTSFSQLMNNAGQRSQNSGAEVNASTSSDKDSYSGRSADVANEHGRPYDTKGKVTDVSKADKDLDREGLRDSVKEVTDEITEAIKEKLDVTDEDIENALEVLGLTVVDLLDNASLQQVFVELSGAQDSLSLLTDGDLYQGLSEILDMARELTSQLADEFGMTPQEFEGAIAKALEENANLQSDLQGEMMMTGDALEESPEDIKSDNLRADEPVIVVNDERTASEEATETLTQVRASKETENESDKSQSRDNLNSEQSLASFTQQTTESEQVSITPTETLSYTSFSEAESISRQIVSQIRVNISNEVTQMEMELNPASLGRVGLTIEAKNGVVTAQFSAQNEAVKAAIEGQITLLQESLDKQGVKVEAVEVTIASHEFEQNLEDQSRDRQQEEAQKAQAIAGRRRMKINLLDDEEDESEEISEEEAINRDMMKKNGNTVDYTA